MITQLRALALLSLSSLAFAPLAPLAAQASGESTGIRFGDPDAQAYAAAFFPGATYDAAVPTPDSILGQELGSRLAHHAEILRCFRAFAAASPRMTLTTFGRTHEGRELVYAVVTSPENHARLDDILADRQALDDPRGLSGDAADALLERVVPVAWMGYQIHGDELSGSDAAVALGYHLAASTDEDVAALLADMVVVIDPCMNPDGRMRILHMVEQSAGYTANLDYASMHRGRWPYGRGNHYLFDMNRDWMAGSQPETAARWEAVARFRPDLFVDSHEMGSLDTFLFYPQEKPINPDVAERHTEWQTIFAAGAAAAFDANGWSYYTREWADGWGPFYSDAWASLTGAIGILYEQASTMGFALKRESGNVLTYRESVHHQIAASMANLNTLAERAPEVLADHLANQQKAVGPENARRAVVVRPGANQARTDELLRILLGLGIEVYRSETRFLATDVEETLGERFETAAMPVGTLVIPQQQPRAQLVRAFLGHDPRLDAEALRSEREALEQTGWTKIYDVTAWSLLHALALDTAWCNVPGVSGERITAVTQRAGGVTVEEGAVAWAVDAADDRALAFAARALDAGLQLHASDRGFTAAGRAFPRGSFLVRKHENSEVTGDVAEHVRRAAEDAGITAYALTTSRSPDTGPDLGGGHFTLLARPRVAMLANAPVTEDLYGHLWHYLDAVLGVSFSQIDAQSFGWSDLRRYNVLILPPGAGGLASEQAEALGTWVEAGGTLIAIADSASAVASSDLSAVTLRRDALDELAPYRAAAERERNAFQVEIDEALIWDGASSDEPEAAEGEESAEAEGAEADEPAEPTPEDDARARVFSPYGVTLRAELNPRSWITAGASWTEAGPRPDALFEMPIFFSGSRAFLAKEPGATAVRLSEAPRLRLGGLLWPEARERIADSAWLTVEGHGSGQVILFACMPGYRGYHAATARLFGNAVVLGPGLGASQPIGW